MDDDACVTGDQSGSGKSADIVSASIQTSADRIGSACVFVLPGYPASYAARKHARCERGNEDFWKKAGCQEGGVLGHEGRRRVNKQQSSDSNKR